MRSLPKFSFVVVILLLSGCHTGYDKEGDSVYYKSWNEGSGSHKDRLDADPKTFVVLKNDRYAKDKNTVFFDGQIIKGADAPTFETLSEFYARDKLSGYHDKNPVKSSHGPTFKVIDAYYSTDGIDVFYNTSPLHVCAPTNFRFVYPSEDGWSRWTTDGCFYYYMNFKVPSDDYQNMTLYKGSGGLSKDKKWVYFLDHKLNYDVDGKKVVDTIDATSFEVTGFLECRDKYGCFNPYHGRKNCNDR